ncbi:hypothetical protein M405DRAFT_868515 [Rhizopogon salebrosus TDB-379]|nr:hypothetical protein M405DRAFT_868515 [Rhizopogon salebrosus TDB-379]
MDTVPRHCGTDAGVGKADELTGPLWRGWKNIPEHDVVRVSLWLLSCLVWGSGDSTYPLHLGLFRLDYLLHAAGDGLSLKQVEFNDISSSSLLGSLSERVAARTTPPLDSPKVFLRPTTRMPNEHNLFDWRWLEYERLEKHEVHVTRQTLAELAIYTLFDPHDDHPLPL